MNSFDSTADFDDYRTMNQIIPGILLFSRYRIVKLLGRGGMGEAWLAEEMEGNLKVQEVVLKRVPPELLGDREQLLKVQNSFNLVRKLRHPNICSALTFLMDGAYGAFCVLDYVSGQDLAELQHQREDRVFSLDETLKVLRPIAEALDYAHRKKVLHRDVKPQNIMVPMDAGKLLWEDAKLIDFDLAIEWHSTVSFDQTLPNHISGTLPYMSPEQIDGTVQDGRSDLYSLGVLAYQMLGGKLPFTSTTPSILIHQILTKELQPIGSQSEQVNLALKKATAKKRADRFDSCGEFVDALEGKTVVSFLHSVTESGFQSIEDARAGKKRLRPVGFDPYYEWLGISPFLPLTHYTLLGLQDFEPNREVITNAADRQMSFVYTYQNGKHAEDSQKLMAEILEARMCLLNPQTKLEYDQRLKNQGVVLLKEVPTPSAPPVPKSHSSAASSLPGSVSDPPMHADGAASPSSAASAHLSDSGKTAAPEHLSDSGRTAAAGNWTVRVAVPGQDNAGGSTEKGPVEIMPIRSAARSQGPLGPEGLPLAMPPSAAGRQNSVPEKSSASGASSVLPSAAPPASAVPPASAAPPASEAAGSTAYVQTPARPSIPVPPPIPPSAAGSDSVLDLGFTPDENASSLALGNRVRKASKTNCPSKNSGRSRNVSQKNLTDEGSGGSSGKSFVNGQILGFPKLWVLAGAALIFAAVGVLAVLLLRS